MKIAESFILKFCFLVCRDQLFDDFGLKTVLFKDFIKCLRVPVSILRRTSRWFHNTVGHHLILLWSLYQSDSRGGPSVVFQYWIQLEKSENHQSSLRKLTNYYPSHYANMLFHINKIEIKFFGHPSQSSFIFLTPWNCALQF